MQLPSLPSYRSQWVASGRRLVEITVTFFMLVGIILFFFFPNHPSACFAGTLVAQTVLLFQNAKVILYGSMPNANSLGDFFTSDQRTIFNQSYNHIQSRLRGQLFGANFGGTFWEQCPQTDGLGAPMRPHPLPDGFSVPVRPSQPVSRH